jgi:hypothetical protein
MIFEFLVVCASCVAHALPEVFSRFSFDNYSEIAGKESFELMPSNGSVLHTQADGLLFANSMASTKSGTNPFSLLLDWSKYSFEFTDGFYVSFWFRFRPLPMGIDTMTMSMATPTRLLLISSDSFDADVVFDTSTSNGKVLLTTTFELNAAESSELPPTELALGANLWCRVTVGFTGNTIYTRLYTLESDGTASDTGQQQVPHATLKMPRVSSIFALGGTFPELQLDFRDVVLLQPQNSNDVMTVDHDEQIARESNPNAKRTAAGGTDTTVATDNIATGDSPHTLPLPFIAGGIAAGAVVLLAVLALSIWLWRRRRGTLTGGTPTPTQPEGTGLVHVMPAPNDTNLAHSNQYGVSPLPRNQYDDVADVQQHANWAPPALYNDVSDVHNQHASEYDSPSSRLQ